MKYTEFILDYASKFRTKYMESGHRATFEKMRGPEVPPGSGVYPQDNRTKNQKTWDISAPLPDGMIELDAEQWQELFKQFRRAFQTMNANRESFSDNAAANTYLDSYYGAGKLFSGTAIAPLDSAAVTELRKIDAFFQTLQHSGDNKTALTVNHIIRQSGFANRAELLSIINSGKYDKDEEARNKIRSFIYSLRSQTKNFTRRELNGEQNEEYITDPALRNSFSAIDLDMIDNGFEAEEPNASPTEMAAFQRDGIYDIGLLQPLVMNEKLRGVFKDNNGGKITEQIEKAIGKTNYKDKESADYVAESEKDKLTPWQQFQRDLKANADDTVLKLRNLALQDKYMRPATSKPIAVDAYSKGFNPKDGLAKFLEIAAKLSDKYKGTNPAVATSLKFLIEALEYCKDKMPMAFAGALKNGEQGVAIDIAIAKYGIKNGKSDAEINTAHEVLSKLRWGYTTSAKREAIFKENINIFSDKNLSWNKNQGLQFVTNALDRGIKLGMRATFELANIGVNAYRRRNRFYTPGDPRGGDMTQAQRERDDNARSSVDANRANAIARRGTINLPVGFDKNQYETDMANLEQRRTVCINRKQRKLTDQGYIDLKNQEQDLTEKREGYKKEKDIFEYLNLQVQAAATPDERREAGLQLAGYKAQLVQKYTNQTPPIAVTVASVEQYVNDQVLILNGEINTVQNDPLMLQTANYVGNLDIRIDRLNTDISSKQEALDNNEKLDAVNEQIREYDDILQTWNDKHKDRFESLMAFRNLVNGRGGFVKDNKMELFFAAQKRVQAKFDRNRPAVVQQYLQQYYNGANVGIDV